MKAFKAAAILPVFWETIILLNLTCFSQQLRFVEGQNGLWPH
jgi:hypothetical protein